MRPLIAVMLMLALLAGQTIAWAGTDVQIGARIEYNDLNDNFMGIIWIKQDYNAILRIEPGEAYLPKALYRIDGLDPHYSIVSTRNAGANVAVKDAHNLTIAFLTSSLLPNALLIEGQKSNLFLNGTDGSTSCGTGIPIVVSHYVSNDGRYLIVTSRPEQGYIFPFPTRCFCVSVIDLVTRVVKSWQVVTDQPLGLLGPNQALNIIPITGANGDLEAVSLETIGWTFNGPLAIYNTTLNITDSTITTTYTIVQLPVSAEWGWSATWKSEQHISLFRFGANWDGVEVTDAVVVFGKYYPQDRSLVLYVANLTPIYDGNLTDVAWWVTGPLLRVNESFALVEMNDTLLLEGQYLGFDFEAGRLWVLREAPSAVSNVSIYGPTMIPTSRYEVEFTGQFPEVWLVPYVHYRPVHFSGYSVSATAYTYQVDLNLTGSVTMTPVPPRFEVLDTTLTIDVQEQPWLPPVKGDLTLANGVLLADGAIALTTDSGAALVPVPAEYAGLQGYSVWWENGTYAGSVTVVGLSGASAIVVNGSANITSYTESSVSFNAPVDVVVYAHRDIRVSYQEASLAGDTNDSTGLLLVVAAASSPSLSAGQAVILFNVTSLYIVAEATSGPSTLGGVAVDAGASALLGPVTIMLALAGAAYLVFRRRH